MRANGVLMIFLIYRGLWSKTLNETIHALLCIFYQKISMLLTQDAPDFCCRCQPVFTACHSSAGESITLTAPQAGVPPLSAGKDARQEAAGPPEPRLCPAPKQPWLARESLGDKGSAAFCDAPAAETGPRHHIIHQAVLTREQLLLTRGLRWVGLGNRPWTKSLCEPFPAPWSHPSPCNAAKEEALFKMKLLTSDREAVAPTHTLFTHCSELAFLQELGRAQSCWFKDTWNKNSRLEGFCSFLACCFFPWPALPAHAERQSAEQQHLCKEAPSILPNTWTSKWKKPKVFITPKKKRLD